jgi:NAD(P)H-quinone oxidoreductase subunit 3
MPGRPLSTDLSGLPPVRIPLLECPRGQARPSGYVCALPGILGKRRWLRARRSKGVRLTGIWYVVGFAFAGVSFVFLTIGAAWLISHRNRGDEHKGLPYESGIDTYGDTHGRFGLSFYIYALLFVAFDIEVIFIYLWAIAFRDLLLGGLVSMFIFVVILLLGLAYAWRKGALTWR